MTAKIARQKLRRARGAGSVSERRGKWHFIINSREAGKRVRRWSEPFDTKAAAEIALVMSRTEDARTKRSRETVGAILKAYLAHVEGLRRSPTTLQRYRGLATNLKPLECQRLETLEVGQIDTLYAALRKEGLSETTIFHVHSLLRAASRWAKRKRHISVDPFVALDIETPRRAKSDVRALTLPDARLILANLDHSPRYRNAIVLALATGMRRGEIMGLRWSSVDFERRTLTVRESRYEIVGKHGNKDPKSGRTREVDLSNMAIAALKDERKRQDALRKAAGDAWERQHDHVFADEHGRPAAPLGLTAAFRHVTEQAGLGGRYTLHGLRHTAATWMLAGGADVKTVQRILGHADATILLKTYAHAIEGRGKAAVDTIEAALQPKAPRR